MALYKCIVFVLDRVIFIPNRDIGRFSLLYKKSGDLVEEFADTCDCRWDMFGELVDSEVFNFARI